MVSLKEAQRRLKKVTEAKLQKKVEEFVLIDLEIRDLKRYEYKRGLDPFGTPIGFYMSDKYEEMKRRKNPLAGGNVDLIDTGKFSNQLFVKSLGNSKFIFRSQDDKGEILEERYGEKIWGLNEETFNNLQKEKYAPKLVRYIKQITRL
jgi:hypothetical protein